MYTPAPRACCAERYCAGVMSVSEAVAFDVGVVLEAADA